MTVDMRTQEILQLSEMLNSERKSYKKDAAALVRSHVKVGLHCEDCGCTMTDFQGHLCKRIFLDSWHAKKHKCSMKLFDPKHGKNSFLFKGLNSEAAEQTWSRMDPLAKFVMHMRRISFRLYLKRYCIWRNNFVRSGVHRNDLNPCRSHKTNERRSRVSRKRPASVV